MNAATGKNPLAELTAFNGLWARGAMETCPPDHLTDCWNCIFPGPGQVSIRENFSVQNDFIANFPAPLIISFAIANVAGGAALITLDTGGNLVDQTHAQTLLTGLGFPVDDFSCLNIFGRSYITLKYKGKAATGAANNYTYVYYYGSGPVYKFLPIGDLAPVGTPTLTQPNAGHVDPGVHTVAVSYLNERGFLTPPSTVATITSDGLHTISISGIPVGGSDITDRAILVSKANQTELFLAGYIGNNVATTYEYTLYDTSLISSADYLNDIYTSLPCCSAIKFYRGRMVIIGLDGTPDNILVSNVSSPETFNRITGVCSVPVDYGINISSSGMVIRDTLYITKPNGTFAVQDNGGDPNTWGVTFVDSAIGAFDNGISTFASSMSAQDVLDTCLVVNKRGLMLFTGSYNEIPLTWKIESLWNMIDPQYFYQVQIAHDIWNKRVYIAVPLAPPAVKGGAITQDPNGVNNLMFMMDYVDGLAPQSVKWSTWSRSYFSVYPSAFTKIAVENFTLNYASNQPIYQLAVCNGTSVISKLVAPQLSFPGSQDLGSGTLGIVDPIWQYIITAPVGKTGITAFTMLDLAFKQGTGKATPAVYNKNRAYFQSYLGFTLTSFNLIYTFQRLINQQTEGIQIQLSCDLAPVVVGANSYQSYFWLIGISVYGTKMFNMRPAFVENY